MEGLEGVSRLPVKKIFQGRLLVASDAVSRTDGEDHQQHSRPVDTFRNRLTTPLVERRTSSFKPT